MKKTIYGALLAVILMGSGFSSAFAQTTSSDIPVITSITATTATVSVPDGALMMISPEERARTYFEYYPTQQVCIMIYPTPENCKPKKTPLGALSATLAGLFPNTEYSVSFKRDNSINCITTPCPSNEYQSAVVSFKTVSQLGISTTFYRNLALGARGSDVIALQTILRARGYLSVNPTGYYGFLTRAAVSLYQRNDMHITPTGTVGPLTRASLNGVSVSTSGEERFSGKITAVSTQCFADGICSVSVDGKKVVTTIGWTGGALGSIRGTATDIGSLESRIGANVNVYAKKTADGYTLYGNTNYYIEVL